MADNLETSQIVVQDEQGNNQLVQAVANMSGDIVWSKGIEDAWCVVQDEQGNKQLALKTAVIAGGGGGGGNEPIICNETEEVTLHTGDTVNAPIGTNIDELTTAGEYTVIINNVLDEEDIEKITCTLTVNRADYEGEPYSIEQYITLDDALSGKKSVLYRYNDGDEWSNWTGYSIFESFNLVETNNSAIQSFSVAENSVRNFTTPLTSLTITDIESSYLESLIYFTADTGITVTLPANTPTIGDFTFTAGKSYVISIQNGIAVRGELN